MTLICAHRINTSAQLETVKPELGVEIDLHAVGDRLVLVHDPFASGEDFEEWLEGYRHRFIVLNTKEEGLEAKISAILADRGVSEWAFLDQSMPYLIRTLKSGERRCMVRVSEFESAETAMMLPDRPDWVWVDSFTGAWPAAHDLKMLVDAGHQLMLVSPELQGRSLDDEFATITSYFEAAGVPIHGVCTKRPDFWYRPRSAWWSE